jgi:hypothetical protein
VSRNAKRGTATSTTPGRGDVVPTTPTSGEKSGPAHARGGHGRGWALRWARGSKSRGAHVAGRTKARHMPFVPIGIAVVALVLGVGGGSAYAFINSVAFGTATATVGTVVPLQVGDPTPTATLMPGMAGTLYFTVTNTNSRPVTLTTLSTITPTSSACGADLKRAVKLPYTLSEAITVRAHTSVTMSLPNVVTLTSQAPTTCQGTTFSVSLVFSGKA